MAKYYYSVTESKPRRLIVRTQSTKKNTKIICIVNFIVCIVISSTNTITVLVVYNSTNLLSIVLNSSRTKEGFCKPVHIYIYKKHSTGASMMTSASVALHTAKSSAVWNVTLAPVSEWVTVAVIPSGRHEAKRVLHVCHITKFWSVKKRKKRDHGQTTCSALSNNEFAGLRWHKERKRQRNVTQTDT